MYQPKFVSRIKIRSLTLPDGSTAFVKKLSQGDVEHINRAYYGPANAAKGQEGFRFVACKAACNEQGERVFTDADLPNLVHEDTDVIQALALAALEFNGLRKPEDPKAESAG